MAVFISLHVVFFSHELIFSRVKQWLSLNFPAAKKVFQVFPFHFEGYVCSIAEGDKFIKTSRFLL